MFTLCSETNATGNADRSELLMCDQIRQLSPQDILQRFRG